MHNVRVPETNRRRPARPSLRALTAPALALAVATGLAGCGGGDAAPDEAAAPSSSPAASGSSSAAASPSTDVSLPAGVSLTEQGSDLSFGDTATVEWQPDQTRSAVLALTVTGARRGALEDFRGFILDDRYKKKAHYYYVDVRVRNVGGDDVGGRPVPLWGVNGDNTLLPPVNFTTTFKPCASTPLPKKFVPGQRVRTCLVYLSPDQGSLDAVSYRPEQSFDPIEWTGTVAKPAPGKQPKPKKGTTKNG